MTDTLDRQTVIELLNRLGEEEDSNVLEAARELHSQVSQSGMGWEELLVPEDDGSEPEEEYEYEEDEWEDDEEEEEEDAPQADLPPVGDDADTLDLIEKLLARPGISDDFREELEDYKTDIADGDFEQSDHRYVRALYARLSKS